MAGQALAQTTASHFTLTEFAAAALLASNMVYMYSPDEQEIVAVKNGAYSLKDTP